MFTSSLLSYLCLNAVINLSAIGISNQIRKKSEQQQSEFEKYCDDMLKHTAEETMKRYKETYAKSEAEAKEESETILKENAIMKTQSNNNKKSTKTFELTESIKNEIIEKVNDNIQLPKLNDFEDWIYSTMNDSLYVRGIISAPSNTAKVFITDDGSVCLDEKDNIIFGNESAILTYCGITGIKFSDCNLKICEDSKMCGRNIPTPNSGYVNSGFMNNNIRPLIYNDFVPHLARPASGSCILISKDITKDSIKYIGLRTTNNLSSFTINNDYIVHDVNNTAIFGMNVMAFTKYKKICDTLPDADINGLGYFQMSNQVISSCMYHEYSGNSIISQESSPAYIETMEVRKKVIEWCCNYYIETGDEITNEIIIQAKNESGSVADKN